MRMRSKRLDSKIRLYLFGESFSTRFSLYKGNDQRESEIQNTSFFFLKSIVYIIIYNHYKNKIHIGPKLY